MEPSKFITIEKRFRPLALAIQLKDTSARPAASVGRLKVSLKNLTKEAFRNGSGSFIYLNLEDGAYTVQIESDYYLPKEFSADPLRSSPPPPGSILSDDDEVQLKRLKNGGVAAQISLMPGPAYPFPSGATLIKGTVKKAGGGPVTGAKVNVEGVKDGTSVGIVEFHTGTKGQFVLYCNRLIAAPSSVVAEDKVFRVIEINGKPLDTDADNPAIRAFMLKLKALHDDLGSSGEITVEVSSEGDLLLKNDLIFP